MEKELLTVLIADDEEPLRQELRSFPWLHYGAELAGEAENGEEALALCARIRPDVIVTDITMPLMDGLELSRRVRAGGFHTQVILLTCHSEFGYAREALKLGALEYLVKVSLDEADLGQALGRAREAIRLERARLRSEAEQRRAGLSRILARALKEPSSGAELSLAGDPSPVGYPLYAARLLCLPEAGDRIHVLHEVREALEQAAQRTGEEGWLFDWVPHGESELLLFLGSPGPGLPPHGEAAAWLRELIARLEARIERELPQPGSGVRFFAMLRGPAASARELLAALRETAPIALHFFYGEGDGVVHAEAALPRPGGRLPQAAADLRTMEAGWREAAGVPGKLPLFLRETWHPWARKLALEPEELKRWVIRRWEETAPPDMEPAGKEGILRRLGACACLTDLLDLLIRSAEEAAGSRPKIRREVQRAMELIRRGLAEPITLGSIARDVGLSPSYLSRLFREEAGEPFNEYVTKVRIERAVELLQTAPLKVYEVAEQVGIPSYRYFSLLFRSRTGVSPTEYKRG
ncbi:MULTISPECIES: response regulator [Paenibacillus]|uniref:response regulator n=1 Tax=Paenibacillus TaxID=44249 RepID=UPI0022B93586|nr:response regulator [Paenibacillus caseinilyticus]MCZ8523505.1 response regulator [Paenibacillus caseinilyticus]